ncbi:MAG: hypothetical protein JW924_04765, partial [Fusobacteriaceae bacterium]|nr:hypothetical protein [Fusobacteriaceae bacterium]
MFGLAWIFTGIFKLIFGLFILILCGVALIFIITGTIGALVTKKDKNVWLYSIFIGVLIILFSRSFSINQGGAWDWMVTGVSNDGDGLFLIFLIGTGIFGYIRYRKNKERKTDYENRKRYYEKNKDVILAREKERERLKKIKFKKARRKTIAIKYRLSNIYTLNKKQNGLIMERLESEREIKRLINQRKSNCRKISIGLIITFNIIFSFFTGFEKMLKIAVATAIIWRIAFTFFDETYEYFFMKKPFTEYTENPEWRDKLLLVIRKVIIDALLYIIIYFI